MVLVGLMYGLSWLAQVMAHRQLRQGDYHLCDVSSFLVLHEIVRVAVQVQLTWNTIFRQW